MKILTFSRHFPKGHPKAGQPTHFVEKILRTIHDSQITFDNLPSELQPLIDDYELVSGNQPKYHTIRIGSRWKAGDMASLRVWSDKPYRSKQVEFAQVEVKMVWEIEICEFWWLNNQIMEHQQVKELARNDGLLYTDFVEWFNIHPKKQGPAFEGQVISWSAKIDYTPTTINT